jgi:prophage antirepressor-like protein
MKIAQFQQFSFEGCNIRTTAGTSGTPWFQAGDVCKVRVIANSRHALTRLEQVRRSALPPAETAFSLNRAQQTLNLRAMSNEGPVKCLRINGRLDWHNDAICKLLGV